MANCTINEKLQYILETKDLIKAALETQDIEVLESDTFRKYAEYITEIRKVSSVNGKVGDVTITAEELGALTEIPSEYITETELNDKGYLTSIPDDYALKTDIPTNVSELNNDANYITLNEVPKTDLSDYYTKEEVDGKIPDVSDFITSIPSEYITETELNDKGYLTSIPDTYITEGELTTALSDKVSQTALNEAIEGIDVGVKTINNTKGDVNIKTINGESILGEGNVEIKSGSDIEEYVKKINVDLDNSQIIYYYKNTDEEGSSPIIFKTVNGESLLGMGDIEIEGGGGVVTETDPIFTSWKDDDSIVAGKNAVNGYTNFGILTERNNVVVIGNNAKVQYDGGVAIGNGATVVNATVNGVAIGVNAASNTTLPTNINDVIKGDSNKYAYIKDENGDYIKILDLINNGGGSSEGGSVKVVELTQAEYDALETKEEGVIYVITDAPEISIPTKLSELENDKGYITEIPSEYVTDTELNNKKYITDSDLTTTIAPLIVNVIQSDNTVDVERYNKVKHSIYYKTINGESILGEGDIQIKGGGGSGSINIIELTQEEYNALTSYDDDTFYVITDVNKQYVIQSDLDNYYTKSEIDSLIGNVSSKITEINNLI